MGPSWKNSPSAGLAQNKEEGAQGSRLRPSASVFVRVLTKIPFVSVSETHADRHTHIENMQMVQRSRK